MTGVYGDFISNFPELYETMIVWEEGKERQKIRAVFIPEKGLSLARLKEGIDVTGLNAIYVPVKECSKIKIGMFFKRNEKDAVQKIINDLEYYRSGDFHVFLIEKVTGVNPEQNGILNIAKPIYS